MHVNHSLKLKIVGVVVFAVVLVLALGVGNVSAQGPSASDSGRVMRLPAFPALATATRTTIIATLGSPVFGAGYTAGTGTQTGRLFRDGVPSTCAAPKVSPSIYTASGSRKYDTYKFTNTSNASGCVQVTFNVLSPSGAPGHWVVAYNGSFNPANLQQNYLADTGSSTWNGQGPVPFSFNLGAGASVVFVVQEVDPSIGGDYRLDVDMPFAPAEVPESDTLLLLAGGLGGFTTWLGWQWRKQKRK